METTEWTIVFLAAAPGMCPPAGPTWCRPGRPGPTTNRRRRTSRNPRAATEDDPMTEAEWLACTAPTPMLELFGGGPPHG